MGSDLTVVNAARVSFDKESWWETEYDHSLSTRDRKLIRYLAYHNHFTPFTHCIITLRETVPIFVARQRFKHTVGFSYNEISRRYVDYDPSFYIPTEWRKRAEDAKQGSSDETIIMAYRDEVNLDPCYGPPHYDKDHRAMWYFDEQVTEYVDLMLDMYKALMAAGVCPEQARMVLPQNMFTSYYVTGSLAAFARAYMLRTDTSAQWEIREFAKEWDRIIRPLFPISWQTLTEKKDL